MFFLFNFFLFLVICCCSAATATFLPCNDTDDDMYSGGNAFITRVFNESCHMGDTSTVQRIEVNIFDTTSADDLYSGVLYYGISGGIISRVILETFISIASWVVMLSVKVIGVLVVVYAILLMFRNGNYLKTVKSRYKGCSKTLILKKRNWLILATYMRIPNLRGLVYILYLSSLVNSIYLEVYRNYHLSYCSRNYKVYPEGPRWCYILYKAHRSMRVIQIRCKAIPRNNNNIINNNHSNADYYSKEYTGVLRAFPGFMTKILYLYMSIIGKLCGLFLAAVTSLYYTVLYGGYVHVYCVANVYHILRSFPGDLKRPFKVISAIYLNVLVVYFRSVYKFLINLSSGGSARATRCASYDVSNIYSIQPYLKASRHTHNKGCKEYERYEESEGHGNSGGLEEEVGCWWNEKEKIKGNVKGKQNEILHHNSGGCSIFGWEDVLLVSGNRMSDSSFHLKIRNGPSSSGGQLVCHQLDDSLDSLFDNDSTSGMEQSTSETIGYQMITIGFCYCIVDVSSSIFVYTREISTSDNPEQSEILSVVLPECSDGVCHISGEHNEVIYEDDDFSTLFIYHRFCFGSITIVQTLSLEAQVVIQSDYEYSSHVSIDSINVVPGLPNLLLAQLENSIRISFVYGSGDVFSQGCTSETIFADATFEESNDDKLLLVNIYLPFSGLFLQEVRNAKLPNQNLHANVRPLTIYSLASINKVFPSNEEVGIEETRLKIERGGEVVMWLMTVEPAPLHDSDTKSNNGQCGFQEDEDLFCFVQSIITGVYYCFVSCGYELSTHRAIYSNDYRMVNFIQLFSTAVSGAFYILPTMIRDLTGHWSYTPIANNENVATIAVSFDCFEVVIFRFISYVLHTVF